MNLILIGPPGSGKGTQAERLRDKYNITHISSGEILRGEVKAGTEFGKKIKYYMDRGEIGPQELITEIVLNYLTNSCQNGFLLDGFPRTLYQAEELGKKHKIYAVFFLDVPEAEIVSRITGRRSCENCNKIYHIKSSPPKTEGICDECGSKLIQRDDDNEATVSKRIKVYLNETAPVVEYYRNAGLLNTINGSDSPDNIFKAIISHL